MTPDQYRREGADAMREAAANEWQHVKVEGGRAMAALLAYEARIRAIDVDEVLAKVGDGWQTPAALDVLAERRRQIKAEGWTPDHDDAYQTGDLADAAACYAMNDPVMDPDRPTPVDWPWPPVWWKPTDRRRDLVKAGALILAEIERLDRATPPQETPNDRD